MRSLQELQEKLHKKEIAFSNLTQEECVLLFDALTADYRHGRLQDEELFLACAQQIRSFRNAGRPNEGVSLAKPEAELRRQISAEKKKQACRMRRLIPLVATVCVLGACSLFAIAASLRTIRPQLDGPTNGLTDGSKDHIANVCEGTVSQQLDLAVSNDTSSQSVSDVYIDSAPSDTIQSGYTTAANDPGCSKAPLAEPDTSEESMPEKHTIQDLETLRSMAETLFGQSPLLPWSLESELQQADGMQIDETMIVLHTSRMTLEIQPFRSGMTGNDYPSLEESSDESFSDGALSVDSAYTNASGGGLSSGGPSSGGVTQELPSCAIDSFTTSVSEEADGSLCITFCKDGFIYRLTVRDAETLEAIRIALQ